MEGGREKAGGGFKRGKKWIGKIKVEMGRWKEGKKRTGWGGGGEKWGRQLLIRVQPVQLKWKEMLKMETLDKKMLGGGGGGQGQRRKKRGRDKSKGCWER